MVVRLLVSRDIKQDVGLTNVGNGFGLLDDGALGLPWSTDCLGGDFGCDVGLADVGNGFRLLVNKALVVDGAVVLGLLVGGDFGCDVDHAVVGFHSWTQNYQIACWRCPGLWITCCQISH